MPDNQVENNSINDIVNDEKKADKTYEYASDELLAEQWEKGEVTIKGADKSKTKNEKKFSNKIGKICKAGSVIITIAGVLVITKVATPVVFAKFVALHNEREYEHQMDLARSDFHSYNKTAIEEFIVSGSNLDIMITSSYADVYAEYKEYEQKMILAADIRAMNLQGADIKIREGNDIKYSSITAEDIRNLMDAYWELKNTAPAQTIGTEEYDQFQKICNLLLDCEISIEKYNERHGADIAEEMYLVVMAAHAADTLCINGNEIENIQFNEDHNRIIFTYDGEVYETEKINKEIYTTISENNIPTARITIINTAVDDISPFSAKINEKGYSK